VRRIVELGVLAVALAVIVALRWQGNGTVSIASTFDGGPNGYEALYNVMRGEGVDVTRSTQPIALLPSRVRVFVTTTDENGYDAADQKRLKAMLGHGVRVVAFRVPGEAFPKGTVLLDGLQYTNLALERRPKNALRAYRALAGRGLVAFDEYRHGYGAQRSIWSILPLPVRIACALAILALLLAIAGANIRFAPPIVREPPNDRDSSAYIVSMARLHARIRAPHVPILRKDHS
jgi:hypothetical protein